jgi:hypothetical protein
LVLSHRVRAEAALGPCARNIHSAIDVTSFTRQITAEHLTSAQLTSRPSWHLSTIPCRHEVQPFRFSATNISAHRYAASSNGPTAPNLPATRLPTSRPSIGRFPSASSSPTTSTARPTSCASPSTGRFSSSGAYISSSRYGRAWYSGAAGS